MDLIEYDKVKNMTYVNYCEYLYEKYKDCQKTGLFKHHTFENRKANLSNPEVAKTATEEERNSITYCHFDEHLLLHILIGEQTDPKLSLGIGGAINYIIPELRNYFETGQHFYKKEFYSDLNKDVFIKLCSRCEQVIQNRHIVLEHNVVLYKQMEDCLQNYNKALIVLGTGLGKTTTALEYLWNIKRRGIVIVPNNLIKDSWNDYSDWVDIITYQAFSKCYNNLNYDKYGIVIVDEAHHCGYDEEQHGAFVWGKGIKYLMDNNIKVLGLTATPIRSDGIDIGMAMFNGCVCTGISIEDGIRKGLIHPFSYITSIYDTESLIKKYNNCKNKKLIGQLNVAINNTPTVQSILKKYAPSHNIKGIVFIQNISDEFDAIQILKNTFPDIQINTIHTNMSSQDILKNREWFKQTTEGFLVAVNMVSEGAHYAGVNILIMFRRTNSYLLFSQQLGRIITLTKNQNPNAVVFDLVNNIENITYASNKLNKDGYGIYNTINALKELKSSQIIIRDETVDIVNCLKDIKNYNDDDYSDWEIDILKNNFLLRGAAYCQNLIKNSEFNTLSKERTLPSIMQKAHRLGIMSARKRSIWCAELDKTYDSISDARKECGGTIMECLRNENADSTAAGFHWAYVEDFNRINYLKKYIGNTPQQRIKRVRCVETGVIYASVKDAEDKTGENIWAVLKSRSANRQGHHYQYIDDENEIAPQQKIVCYETGEIFNTLAIARKEKNAPSIGNVLNKPHQSSGGYHWCDVLSYNSGWHPINTQNKSCKKVFCIEQGVLYKSITDAKKSNKIKNDISISCNDWSRTCGGYHWCWEKDIDSYKPVNNDYKGKKILNVDTNEIFEGLKEVIKIYPISKSTLFRAIKDATKTAGGYHWKYVD